MTKKTMSSDLHDQTEAGENKEIYNTPEVTETIESFKKLSPQNRDLIIQAINSEYFRGPLPHPRILKGYEEVQEGFAERIVRMAEKEQENRFSTDRDMIMGTIRSNSRGQWMGFVIAILFLIATVVLGILGQTVIASIIGGGTLVSLVTVFVTNQSSKNNSNSNT